MKATDVTHAEREIGPVRRALLHALCICQHAKAKHANSDVGRGYGACEACPGTAWPCSQFISIPEVRASDKQRGPAWPKGGAAADA